MNISDLKEKRIIHEPTPNFDKFGNRIYEQFEYNFKFKNGSDKNNSFRLFAKIIDIIPIFLAIHYILNQNFVLSFIYSIPIVILIGAVSESITGTTIGKKIFNLKVVDDHCNYPKLSKSLKRNLLCLINLFPSFSDYQSRMRVWGTRMNFNMQLNNHFCKTFVLKKDIYIQIQNLLNKN